MDILLIEDHPLYRQALGTELSQLFPELMMTEVSCLSDAFDTLNSKPEFDLILYDLNLPDSSGLRGLLAICQMTLDIPVVVISATESRDIIEAVLKTGARGYIPKSQNTDVIMSAINLVMSGETYVPSILLDENFQQPESGIDYDIMLTGRQNDVIQLLAKGCSNKEIGTQLEVAETTVRVHVTDILKKLRAHNRTEAVIKAQELGLVDITH